MKRNNDSERNQLCDVPISHDNVRPENFVIHQEGDNVSVSGQCEGDPGVLYDERPGRQMRGRGASTTARRQLDGESVAEGRGLIKRRKGLERGQRVK